MSDPNDLPGRDEREPSESTGGAGVPRADASDAPKAATTAITPSEPLAGAPGTTSDAGDSIEFRGPGRPDESIPPSTTTTPHAASPSGSASIPPSSARSTSAPIPPPPPPPNDDGDDDEFTRDDDAYRSRYGRDDEDRARARKPQEDRSQRRSGFESLLRDSFRKAVERGLEVGMGTLKSADHVVHKVADEVKMPKEISNYLFSQIDETKNVLIRAVAGEVREFLDTTDLATELQRALTALSFEVRMEIRFIPNEAGELKPKVKTKATPRARRTDRPERGRGSRGASDTDGDSDDGS